MLKSGMKLRCSGSGRNSDFKPDTDYILNEVVDEIEGTYLVTIRDDGDFFVLLYNFANTPMSSRR